MAPQYGNLSSVERNTSALLGVGFAVVALSRGSAVLRALCGILAGGLLSRASAGHCGVKSALTGTSTLRDGMRDQWRGMANEPLARAHGLAGSPLRHTKSEAVDQSIDESFPASDPPASRLPDDPPANAEAKWAAARAAGEAPK
jgi:hypothetical protein